MIIVSRLAEVERPELDRFLLEDSDVPIYPSVQFARFLECAIGISVVHLVARDECGHIVGVLPFASLIAPEIGALLNSLPWYGSHGGCTVSPDRNEESREALLRAFRTEIDLPHVIASTVVLPIQEAQYVDTYVRILEPTASEHRIGQSTRLPNPGPDAEKRLERVLEQKTRNLVRKSLKQGFALLQGDDDSSWRFLCATHADNMEAIGGKPKPWSHFAAIRGEIPGNARRLLIALDGDRPVAALLLLRFGRCVEYLTPTIVREYRSRQPMSFLIWHAMIEAIHDGFVDWNWGGTWESQRTLHHFKAGWGAIDRPYSYLSRATPGGIDVLKRFRERLGELFPYFYAYPFTHLQ